MYYQGLSVLCDLLLEGCKNKTPKVVAKGN